MSENTNVNGSAPQAGDTPLARPSQRNIRDVVQAQGKALQQVLPAVQGLVHNGQVAQKRIEAIERRLDQHEAFEMMTWWERVKWLAVGR